MRSTPAPASLPVIATTTGQLVYQPAEQAIELQVTELVGAAESDWAVKLVPAAGVPGVVLRRDRAALRCRRSC